MEHFTKRLYACIIDFIVVFLLISIVTNILFIPLSLLKSPFISAYYPYAVTVIVTMAYFTIMESKTNKTIGKMLMKLYVSDEEGYLSYFAAFIRNITKCFWILLIFDVLIGKILGFPSRLFDKIAKTDVYADDELEVYDENDNTSSTDKSSDIIEDKSDKKSKEAKVTTSKTNSQDKQVVKKVTSQNKAVKKAASQDKQVAKKATSQNKAVKKANSEVKKTTQESKKEDNTSDKQVKTTSKDKKSEDKKDEPGFIFADDSDIKSTYTKKPLVEKQDNKKQSKTKNSTGKKDTSAQKPEKTNDKQVISADKKQSTPEENTTKEKYEDEILDLIIEEDEHDSFVELTKDDF